MPVAALARRSTARWSGCERATSGARQVKRAARAAEPGRRIGRAAARRPSRPRRRAARRRRGPPARRGPARGTPAARTGRARPRAVPRTSGWRRACGPPRITSRGLRMLTRPAEPDAQPAPDVGERRERRRRTRPRPRAARRRCRPGRRRRDSPASASSMPSPTSVSQQPDRPAAARQPVRVDRQVADLAGEAGGAGQQPPVDDEAAADADLARDVQDVVHARSPRPAGARRGRRRRRRS